MAKFVLTAQLQLQAPRNVQQVVRQIQNQLNNVKVKVDIEGASKAQTDLKKLDKGVKQVTDSAHKMGQAFAVSVKRFAAFSIATRAIGLLTRGLGGAVAEAIDFERQLTKVAQVTGKSIGQLKDLTREITRLSTRLGVSSKSLIEVSRTLSQAGLDAQETKVALEALAKTSLAATFTDIHQTAEGAVAIFNQFGKGAAALEKQLGSINAVAGQFAVEAGDIIAAIRRTGGVFKAAGGDLNELIALFTSVRATTRESAESIATGLRTIFTRIQRPSTMKFLKELGVELKNAEGKFVGPFEAVKRLSEALSDLQPGDLRFVQIAEQLGGFRQIGKVIPLLQQFAVAQDALNVAMEGTDSLTKDAMTAQQALAVRITKVKEEFLALIRSVTESKTFQVMANTAISLASALIKIADALKPLLPMLATMAAMKIFGGIKSFSGGLLGRGAAGGGARGFASGGLVPGQGSRDTVPAMLTPGEFVIKKSSVKSIGSDRLAGMNKYAAGGTVRRGRNAYGTGAGGMSTDDILAAARTGPSVPSGPKRAKSKIRGQGSSAKPLNFTVLPGRIGAFFLDPANRPQGEDVSTAANDQFGLNKTSFTIKPGDKAFGKLIRAGVTTGSGLTTPGALPLDVLHRGKGVRGKPGAADKKSGVEGVLHAMLKGNRSSFSGFFPATGNLKNNKKINDKVMEATSSALADAVGAVGSQVAPFLKAGSISAGFSDAAKKAIRNDDNAVKSSAGFVFEGLIHSLTGASPGGGTSGFDFPFKSIKSARPKLEGLFGSGAGRMIKADAKRDWNKRGEIKNKLLNDIKAGDWMGVALGKVGLDTPQVGAGLGSRNKGQHGVLPPVTKDTTFIKRASGGSVTDTVPSLLTPGEFVVNKKSAQGIGYGNLYRMNQRGAEGFASGGVVGGPRKFQMGGMMGGMGMSGGNVGFALAAGSAMAGEGLISLRKATDEEAEGIRRISGMFTQFGAQFGTMSMLIDNWKGKKEEESKALEDSAKAYQEATGLKEEEAQAQQEWIKLHTDEGKSMEEIGKILEDMNKKKAESKATSGMSDNPELIKSLEDLDRGFDKETGGAGELGQMAQAEMSGVADRARTLRNERNEQSFIAKGKKKELKENKKNQRGVKVEHDKVTEEMDLRRTAQAEFQGRERRGQDKREEILATNEQDKQDVETIGRRQSGLKGAATRMQNRKDEIHRAPKFGEESVDLPSGVVGMGGRATSADSELGQVWGRGQELSETVGPAAQERVAAADKQVGQDQAALATAESRNRNLQVGAANWKAADDVTAAEQELSDARGQRFRQRDDPGAAGRTQAEAVAAGDLTMTPGLEAENANRVKQAQAKLDQAKQQALGGGGTMDTGGGGGGGAAQLQQLQVQAQQVNIQAQNVSTSEGGGGAEPLFKTTEMAAAEAELARAQDPTMDMGSVGSRYAAGADTTAEEASLAGAQQRQQEAALLKPGDMTADLPEGHPANADLAQSTAEQVAAQQQLNDLLDEHNDLANEANALSEEYGQLQESLAANGDKQAENQRYLNEAILQEQESAAELLAIDQALAENAEARRTNGEELAMLGRADGELHRQNNELLAEAARLEAERKEAAEAASAANKELGRLDETIAAGPEALAVKMGASKLTSAVGGKDSEAGKNIGVGMEAITMKAKDAAEALKGHKKFLVAYSKELARGVDPAKAMARAMAQAAPATSKMRRGLAQAAAGLRNFGSKAKKMGGAIKEKFAAANKKMEGFSKALGAGISAATSMVSFVQGLQQEQFDKALESGDADTAMGMTESMGTVDKIGGAVQGAAMGAAMGAMFGPLGMAIGALIGAIGGLVMAFLGADKKQIEREKKIHAVRVKSAQESTGKAMENISEKGLQEGNLKDMNAGFKQQEALMNKRNTVNNQLLLTEEEREKMEKRLAGEQLKAATLIGKSVKTEAELEAAMSSLANDTIGSSEAEMDAARSAFFVAQANRELAKSNADLIKITSAFQRATSAVDNFVNGLETGTNRFDSIVSDLEMSQQNIALGQGGVASVDAARDATMKGLERAGVRGDSDVGQAVDRSFKTMENTASFMSNLPGKLENLNFGEDKSAAGARDTIRSQLMTADMDPKLKGAIEKAMAGMSDQQLEAIAKGEGDISQLLKGVGTQMNKLGQAGLEAAKALQKHEATIIKLTQKRIQAEANYIVAQKKSIDIMMEANEIIAKVGGPAVTPEMKTQATLAKANLGSDKLGLTQLKTGSADELRQRTNEIMQKFGQQEIAGRTPDTFSGSQGLDDDKRADLQKAMQDQISLHKELIKGKMEELKILDKKNALEKSSLEDALKGDMQSFLKKQAAVGATAAAASGDQRMMRMFGVDAIAEAFSNVEKMKQEGVQDVHGVNIQDVSRSLASTGLAMRGLGSDPRMTDMLAGQMPEQEALKNEIKDLAVGLSETGQGAAQLAEMQVQTANITIATANFKFNQQLNQAAGLFGGGAGVDARRWGGMIHASKGMFIPRGTDTVPAMLTPGEFVVRKESVNRGNNLQLLRGMNSGSVVSDGSIGFSRGGQVGYYQRGGTVDGGAGIGLDPTVANNLSASLIAFNKDLAANISSLENMKFQIRLDTTNINVNLNGTSFLAQLKDSLKEELLAEVGSRIKELKFNDAGEPQSSSSVLG